MINLKPHKAFLILNIALFLIVVSIPLLGFLFGISASDNFEWRTLAKFPQIKKKSDLPEFPKKFETFFNDNFGFRELMIKTNGLIKVNIFKTSPFPDEILGKSNWIFYNSLSKNDFKQWYSHVEFSEGEMKQLITTFKAEKDWLSKRGIPYVLVIVPDKEIIYSEYYPYPGYFISNFALEQFMSGTKNSNLDILYLKEDLFKAKKENELPLYYFYDTHWNDLGTFIGYQSVMNYFKKINPRTDVLQLSDFDIVPKMIKKDLAGDLMKLDLNQKIAPEIRIDFIPKERVIKSTNKINQLYIYGDSFTTISRWDTAHKEGLLEFLKLSFTDVVYNADNYMLDYAKIEKDKPDLVIRQIVQRNLWRWTGIPSIPPPN